MVFLGLSKAASDRGDRYEASMLNLEEEGPGEGEGEETSDGASAPRPARGVFFSGP